MSEIEGTTLTHQAMLVAWGQYVHCIGLVSELEAIPLHQKAVRHRGQMKVLESPVSILAGFQYFRDISASAHPLDKDQAVAQAWSPTGWADHSGVSRTLSQLTDEEAPQIILALERVSHPLIDRGVVLAVGTGRLELDGDLTPKHPAPGERIGEGRHAHLCLGPLVGSGLFVNVQRSQRLCWPIIDCQKDIGLSACVAVH
jgi:hypothetical protein